LSSSETYTEHELLRLTANGDRKAFTAILHKFWNKVYTQAITWLKCPQDAQEITQDIFVAVWQERAKLAGVNNLSAWLSTITRHKVSSALRRPRRSIEETENLLAHSGYDPEQSLLYKESYHILQNGINALPPARKKVFLMSRMENKSYEDIAAELNISRNGVKDHIVRALNFLRQYLENHAGDTAVALFIIADFLKKNA